MTEHRIPVLFIAFHFPPCFGSSGIQRTLSFVRYFADATEFRPVVLTATGWSYPQVSPSQLPSIPDDVRVYRIPALDAARHLSVKGRYPDALARPDRWRTWSLAGIPAGRWLIRKYQPAVIWSTYPISTAMHIGHQLAQTSKVPWLCDFRDPMVEFDSVSGSWFPAAPSDRDARLAIEERCVADAERLVFATKAAKDIVLDRYGAVSDDRCAIIPNGYNEAVFAEAEKRQSTPLRRTAGVKTLVHSGTLYPGEDRDPSAFFRALRQIRDETPGALADLRIVLRASGFDEVYRPMLEKLSLTDIVSLAPSIDYADAIQEMLAADGLLLFQGRTSNPAIPAKVYEYFRAGKPIFALVDEAGETAKLLARTGVNVRTPLDDEALIRLRFLQFLDAVSNCEIAPMPESQVKKFSRDYAADRLANIIRELTHSSS